MHEPEATAVMEGLANIKLCPMCRSALHPALDNNTGVAFQCVNNECGYCCLNSALEPFTCRKEFQVLPVEYADYGH